MNESADNPAQHRWTDTERAYLRQHCRAKTRRELADDLGVTPKAVQHQISALGTARTVVPRKTWTAHEDQMLESLREHYSAKAIARRLGRSVAGVTNRLCRLGLLEARDWFARREVAKLLDMDRRPYRNALTTGACRLRQIDGLTAFISHVTPFAPMSGAAPSTYRGGMSIWSFW